MATVSELQQQLDAQQAQLNAMQEIIQKAYGVSNDALKTLINAKNVGSNGKLGGLSAADTLSDAPVGDARGFRQRLELGSAATRNAYADDDSALAITGKTFASASTPQDISLNNVAYRVFSGSSELTKPVGYTDCVAIGYRANVRSDEIGAIWVMSSAGRFAVHTTMAGKLVSTNEFWTTGNANKDANGFLKASSPIVRLINGDNLSKMGGDFVDEEGGFKLCGSGAANAEACGVICEKLGIGDYIIRGASGFADDGWCVTLPQSRDGNMLPLVFCTSSVAEDGSIRVKTSKREWNDNAGEFEAGAPTDIPTGRWIDLRLKMPA